MDGDRSAGPGLREKTEHAPAERLRRWVATPSMRAKGVIDAVAATEAREITRC